MLTFTTIKGGDVTLLQVSINTNILGTLKAVGMAYQIIGHEYLGIYYLGEATTVLKAMYRNQLSLA